MNDESWEPQMNNNEPPILNMKDALELRPLVSFGNNPIHNNLFKQDAKTP